MKVVFAGGGTGGHIYPAVAMARAVLRQSPEAQITFVGARGGLEEKLVPREGFPLYLLSVGPLNKNAGWRKRISSALGLPVSFLQAIWLRLRLRPDVIVGVGGYASGPLVLVGALTGVRTLIFEPNAYPGLANRWLARFVDRVLLVFEKARTHLPECQVTVVGLPVRPEIEALTGLKREISSTRLRVLVFGGSQGASAINTAILDWVSTGSEVFSEIEICHQTGSRDLQRLSSFYKEARRRSPGLQIQEHEFLFDMADRYVWADVVICRSGASTVAELIAAGKPALFVPLPTAADDHQTHNARVVSDLEAGWMVPQKEFTPGYLQAWIRRILEDHGELVRRSQNLVHLRSVNASARLAELILVP